jgi:nitrite reductase (NO-forming)
MQTVLLGSSNSAIVEFVVPEDGNYIMVDHQFANASQGAVGLIRAGTPTEIAPEHHNIPATAVPTDPDAVLGKQNFDTKCLACHSIGDGERLGPDILGVTGRRDEQWIARFLRAPEAMLETDPIAMAMMEQYQIPMPNQNLSEEEIRQYIAYFRWVDENLQ